MQELGGELSNRLESLRLDSQQPELGTQSVNNQTEGQRVDTEAEFEDDLAEAEGDGPGDTVGLQVYSTAQHFASMQSLD